MKNNIYSFKQRFIWLFRYEMRRDYFIRSIKEFLERWIEDGFKLFGESLLHIVVALIVIILAPIVIFIKWVFAPVFYAYYSFTYEDEVFLFIEKTLNKQSDK